MRLSFEMYVEKALFTDSVEQTAKRRLYNSENKTEQIIISQVFSSRDILKILQRKIRMFYPEVS